MVFDLNTAREVTGVGDSAIAVTPPKKTKFDFSTAKPVSVQPKTLTASEIRKGATPGKRRTVG